MHRGKAKSSYIAEARLLRAIFGLEVSTSKEISLKLPIGGRGRVIDVKWIQRDSLDIMVRVYILQKREIKVGDKIAGIHGNKGIIQIFLPRQDISYLQDGTPVDMVFSVSIRGSSKKMDKFAPAWAVIVNNSVGVFLSSGGDLEDKKRGWAAIQPGRPVAVTASFSLSFPLFSPSLLYLGLEIEMDF